MGLLVDVTPLRVSRDFRRLWAGQGVSAVGNMITSATALDLKASAGGYWASGREGERATTSP